MRIFKAILILFAFLQSATATGQVADTSSILPRILTINPKQFKSNDSIWIRSGICKPLLTTLYTGETADHISNEKTKPAFLKIHGNIQYDFIYRSLVDTPFYQQGFAQHTLQTNFDLTFRELYPVKVTIRSRQSNSPWFDDITDVSVQFNRSQYLKQIRSRIEKQIPQIPNKQIITGLEQKYQRLKWEEEALQNWISNPARLQELVEAKEKNLEQRLKATMHEGIDSIDLPDDISTEKDGKVFLQKKVFDAAEAKMKVISDSLQARFDSIKYTRKVQFDSLARNDLLSEYKKKQEELKKIRQDLKGYEKIIKGLQKGLQDSIALLKQELSRMRDPAQINNFIRGHHLSYKDLPKGWQAFTSIEQIGIGRTWVDYSDLTVKNISLTGINVEANYSKFYFAVAAGKINYRFRDFIVKNAERNKQQLVLARAGIGRKEGNNLIFTWYDGKRNLLNSYGNNLVVNTPERVMGMSVQSRLQIDPNNYFILESAKSSFHNTGTVNQQNGLLQKVWNFKDHSNEAYSLKLFSQWPQTNTKVNGYYKKTGEHFQSFNLQPVNTEQVSYQFKVQQQFWKRRFQIDAGIRKNDFNSPFINPGLASKTVFKSAQATLRIPKYPFVSVGYYPSSQLTMMDNNVLVENQYNTLNAVVGHSYRAGKLSMSSNAVLLKFYNSGADTGFIYYNATSVTINQFIFFKGWQLQSGLTKTSQRGLKVTTLEQSANYQYKEWLSLTGGLKYNRVNGEQTLWGATTGLGLLIKKLGTIQVSYDKSYLPGTDRNLLPVDMGRLTYYRVF